MKVKLLTLGIALGAALLGSCDDGISLVGPSIQPDRDKINVFQDTIEIQAYTVLMDSIYAKTSSALLGEFYDPTFASSIVLKNISSSTHLWMKRLTQWLSKSLIHHGLVTHWLLCRHRFSRLQNLWKEIIIPMLTRRSSVI